MTAREEKKRRGTKSTQSHIEGYDLAEAMVPEDLIRRFIRSLGVGDVESIAADTQLIADLMTGVLDDQRVTLNRPELQLLRRIARKTINPYHHLIMKSIVDCAGQGLHGINAAKLIANRTVILSFKWTQDYVVALNSYREKLRTLTGRPDRTERSRNVALFHRP